MRRDKLVRIRLIKKLSHLSVHVCLVMSLVSLGEGCYVIREICHVDALVHRRIIKVP